MKKYSILGLMLLVASAITAAILPSKAAEEKSLKGFGGDGIRVADPSGQGWTCTAAFQNQNCDLDGGTSHTGNAATTTGTGTTHE